MKNIKTLFWLPHCSTCQKADAFLQDKGAKIAEYVDVKTQAVPRKTIEALAKAMGGAEALFSKRAMKYRSLGLDKMTLSETDMLDWMEKEYTFIKRPVILAEDGTVLAGFSQKQYLAWLEN
jgi:arsenate reductase (glutaredoxin)